MQTRDFQPDDLFTQIQILVDGLEAERRAREAAETADAAKSEILAVMGHELHASMEGLVAMTDRLLAGSLNGSQRRQAEILAHTARSLLGAVHEVLDFSRLEAGESLLSSHRFDLHGLVRSAASVLQARASAKGLTSGVDMGANCPRFIFGDAVRIRQVLMGLIEAALQSTSEGSVRLYVSVNNAANPLTLRFDITDTGTGMTEAEQESLFRPSADQSRVGGGLGLPIARRLAGAMGGDVGCDSALGQGTLYWFTLQAEPAADQDTMDEIVAEAANDAIPPELAPKGTLSGHVLVVEGNTVNRMLIGAYLDEFGLTYEGVENGAAAIMCLAARRYDLVLMDTVLPDYDGMLIAKRIRSMHAPSSEVPIVAITARDAADGEQDYVAAGINACVSKPIQGRALYAGLVPFLDAPMAVDAPMDLEMFAKAS
ncbi:MAG TPA: response regulator [Methyloceanibacter sp.]|nr:response regulator [Methyloceanibacter sp.]